MAEELRVTIPARLSEVRELSSMVEAFGDANDLPDPKVFVINLALDELITNTVTHGLEDMADAEIRIRMRVVAGTLILVMEDNGQPFDPTQDTNADVTSSLEERAVGGLGLHLVKSFADRVSYEFVEGRNRLTMEHDLAKASE
ncbi:MAG: ATP-binding protein [Acidobacteria bacterium]|jgi:anti-sigma regulatory factor (Ser/Thr protein kinase)|nr:ATP-binding protein [Acidobacteriota bacterium]MYH27787.1 ATP-binding protein [Acidobacteriota bacterium]MYK90367.1 ATP-binding protein [Acidobacteriota bacterium]